jgi:integrase
MASVHKDRGAWCIRWREGGKQRSVRGIASKVLAEAQARRIEAELASQAAPTPGQVLTWDEAIPRYIASRPHATALYLAAVEANLRRAIAGRSTWHDLTPQAVTGLPAYQARILRSFLRWAAEDAGQPVHPRAIAAAKPRVRRKPQRPLPSPDDIADAIARAEAWSPADGIIAHLIATYGHRAQSVVGLTVSAWDPAAGTITLPVKSGDIHRHPVLPATAALLTAQAAAVGNKPDSPLFPSHTGKPWPSGSAFSVWWSHCIGGVGILDLRRTAISRMLALGLDAKTVASITGHRTVSLLLNTYARTTDQRQQDAIAALGCSPIVPHCSKRDATIESATSAIV